MLCAAIWYGLKLQEPCTAKGGRVVNKDHGYFCVGSDGRVMK